MREKKNRDLGEGLHFCMRSQGQNELRKNHTRRRGESIRDVGRARTKAGCGSESAALQES